MRKFLALWFAVGAFTAAHAGTSVGVTIDVHQPGVYGRITIGNAPPPLVVYPQPVIIAPSPVAVVQQPIYLYVPPGHQKNWAKHCARYSACGQPVYFVQETWVRERYVQAHPQPRMREERREHGNHDGGNHGRRERERRDSDNRP